MYIYCQGEHDGPPPRRAMAGAEEVGWVEHLDTKKRFSRVPAYVWLCSACAKALREDTGEEESPIPPATPGVQMRLFA